MCGIVAYIGQKQSYPIILEGLKRLEYRGYDSAGVSILNHDITTVKKKGKVSELETAAKLVKLEGTVGIGHTRWATHGKPDDINAHPHVSNNGRFSLIHNGIIENYLTLKKALEDIGHTFQSETDTEVLVHLIEAYQTKENLNLAEAVRRALEKAVGAYAIVVIDRENPDILVGARKSSPLVLGIGEDEFFLASDASPIIKYTNKVIYLNDEEIVTVSKDGSYEIKNLYNEVQYHKVQELDLKLEELEKEGFEHFMLKEIYQQPITIHESMRGRINAEDGWVIVGGMQQYMNRIMNAKRIIFAACGTSWHSALVAEYLFEELAGIPVEVEYASEFRYRKPIINQDDVVNTHCGSYTHAGPEIGVASTKAFTSQLAVLTLMALNLGFKRGQIPESQYRQLLYAMEDIPNKVKKVLDQDAKVKFIASEIKDFNNALYLGRGYNFPVALEGALKLKEISYVHAEGYPAAEMKHGPIALIDEKMPVVVIATNKSAYDKVASNIQEVKARKGTVISIVTEGDTKIKEMSDYSIEIPDTEEPLTPLLSVIPLQLLAYHVAVMRGCNVDQPRNLAKSVTVE